MQRAIISGVKGTKVKVMNWQTQFNSGEVVYRDDSGMVICGNALDVLRGFPDNSISCVVTSPPYWGLRCYLPDKVQLRKDLTDEEKKTLKKELTLLGLDGIIRI